jgi:hypothetical protein
MGCRRIDSPIRCNGYYTRAGKVWETYEVGNGTVCPRCTTMDGSISKVVSLIVLLRVESE